MAYKSKHTGAQVDEAVSKVLNGDIEGSNIKDGSVPLSALNDELKSEFDCKYGLSGIVTILNSNNTTSDILPIDGYFVYVSLKRTIIKLNIGGQTDLSQLNGPSTIINCEIINGNKVKFSVSGDGISFYGNLIIGNKYYEVPTPDWNAQEGEAGYIENKPFGDLIYNKLNFTDDDWNNDTERYEHIFNDDCMVVKINYTKNDLQHTKILHVNPYSHLTDYIDVVFDDGDCTMGLTHLTDGGTRMTIYGSTLDFINNNIYYTNMEPYESISTISSMYIDDTVIKTTPQSLSEDAQNQALANLGIERINSLLLPNKIGLTDGASSSEEIAQLTIESSISQDIPFLEVNKNLILNRSFYYNESTAAKISNRPNSSSGDGKVYTALEVDGRDVAIKASHGQFAGLRPALMKHLDISKTYLTEFDHTIISVFSSGDRFLYLPKNPENGQHYRIIKFGQHVLHVDSQETNRKVTRIGVSTEIGHAFENVNIGTIEVTYCAELSNWILTFTPSV